jgi:hypothetical protein
MRLGATHGATREDLVTTPEPKVIRLRGLLYVAAAAPIGAADGRQFVAEHARLRDRRPDLWAAYEAWRALHTPLSDDDVTALADPERSVDPGGAVDW